ncbi:hypothetical protein C5S53_01715, partial [Methanophagales archaeon]
LSQITLYDIATTLTNIDPVYIIIGFILYLGTYFFRALRFYILLSNKVNLKDLFSIVCVHNMANNILPARTGEISYVYLANKLHDIPVGEGVAGLMVARVLDFITISFLFFLSAIFISDLPDEVSTLIWLIAGLIAVVLLLFLASIFFDEIVVDKIRSVANRINALRFSVVLYLLRKGDETVLSFKLMKSKKLFGKVFVASIAVWCFQYAMLYILANAMGISLTSWCMLFALTFVFFTSVLPIQTIGGFGIIEGGWALGFMVMGVPKELAISSSFCFHVILLFFTLVIGIPGCIIIYTKNRTQ